jgi:hypothetical protein
LVKISGYGLFYFYLFCISCGILKICLKLLLSPTNYASRGYSQLNSYWPKEHRIPLYSAVIKKLPKAAITEINGFLKDSGVDNFSQIS